MTRENQTADDRSRPGPRPVRRRRRWLRRLAVLLGLLAVLAWAAPYLIATEAGTAWVVSLASGRIRGRLAVEDLSLSWLGPCEARGLKAWDPAGREVLAVAEVRYARGAWHAIVSAEEFERISVEAPAAKLHVRQGPDGPEVSLLDAFRPVRPPRPRPRGDRSPAAPPEPVGRIDIRAGSATVVIDDGRRFQIRRCEGHADLRGLDEITGEFRVEPAGGGALAGRLDLQGLSAGGRVGLERANGKLELRSDGDMDLAAVADLLAQPGLAGKVRLQASAAVSPGKFAAEFDVNVSRLSAGRLAEASAKPIDLAAAGTATLSGEDLSAKIELTGQAGRVQAAAAFKTTAAPPSLDAAKLLAAALAGDPVELPEFRLTASGEVNLAAVGRAVPALLRLRRGVEVTGGKLTITDVSIVGGAAAAGRGKLAVEDLRAARGGRMIGLAPMVAEFDVLLERGLGLRVRRGLLEADFARVSADGVPKALTAEFQTDLARLRGQLGEVFDLGDTELAGTVSGRLDVRRRDEKRVDFEGRADAASLRYKAGQRVLDVQKAIFRHTGHLTLADRKPVRLTFTEAQADLDAAVLAGATGWYDLTNGGFQLRADLRRADLAYLAAHAKELGAPQLSRFRGELAGTANVTRAAGGRAATSSGNAVVRGLRVDGRAVTEKDITLQWSDGRLDPDQRLFSSALARLDSDPARLTAREVRCRLGTQPAADGRIELAADLAKCAAALRPLVALSRLPELAGQLAFDGTARTAGGLVSLDGSGGVDALQIGTGTAAVREDRVGLVLRADLRPEKEHISLHRLKVDSKPLAVEVAGTVEKYRGEQVLALTGRYRGDWARLTPLLHALAPATAGKLALAGQTQSEFAVTGPARRPKVRPTFRGLTARAGAAWGSGRLLSWPLGKVVLSPRLADGRATLPAAEIPAGGGKLRAGGEVNFTAAEPVLTVGKLQVLEDVPVDVEIGEVLLSRFNPVFHKVSRLVGRTSLYVESLEVPLSEAIHHRGTGSGRLELAELKILPSGAVGALLGELLKLGGLRTDEAQPARASDLNFRLEGGRIHYRDFKLSFAGNFDLVFSGSVGLDERLELVCSIPVRAAVLERFGVGGRAAAYARHLEGAAVPVRIGGTRRKPRLEFRPADIAPLIQRAIQAILAEQLGRLRKPQTQPATRPPKTPEQQLIESIFDLLRKRRD